MAILTTDQVRAAARVQEVLLKKSATASLNESVKTALTSFDIFLSHSRLDAELILGVKVILERSGKSVYVDWIDDPQMSRDNVTSKTAETLRRRMRQCQSLFYAHSGNASKSRWMPWELGYFDGRNGNVAILPIISSPVLSYKGEEFLGLYPYVDVTSGSIYIHKSISQYAQYDTWKAQTDKLHPAS